MASVSLHISLPEPLKAYVDTQIELGNYSTPDDFFRDLIEEDRERHVADLEERLLRNMRSKAIPISRTELDQNSFLDLCRKKLQENA